MILFPLLLQLRLELIDSPAHFLEPLFDRRRYRVVASGCRCRLRGRMVVGRLLRRPGALRVVRFRCRRYSGIRGRIHDGICRAAARLRLARMRAHTTSQGQRAHDQNPISLLQDFSHGVLQQFRLRASRVFFIQLACSLCDSPARAPPRLSFYLALCRFS